MFDERLNKCSEALVRLSTQFESYRVHVGDPIAKRVDRLEEKGLLLRSELDKSVGKAAVWTAVALVALQTLAGILLAKIWGISLG